MFNLNEYMLKNRVDELNLVERIICKDGFTVSAQSSKYAYCTPRESNLPSYLEVELGYPSEYMGKEFDQYAEDLSRPTDTVYAWVPVELVEALVEKHGGLKDKSVIGAVASLLFMP